jgi:NadR type nicotinamide-nucleotide adenylyltransferase
VTQRIVVTGSESTGKTTLAAELAVAYPALLLPEMARTYAEERLKEGFTLTADDVGAIARRAIAAEDAALVDAPPLVILDTDLLSTVVYARYYYGACPAWIEAVARERLGDLYLLCLPDIPWLPDGVRDQRDNRDELHVRFQRTLAEFGAHVTEVAGTREARKAMAVAAVASVAGAANA